MTPMMAHALIGLSLLAAAAPPRVVRLEPKNRAVDLDAKKTKQLIIEFDQPMNASAWSLCGGGPAFPPIQGTPRWETPKKLVVDVKLEPGHEYQLMLNCPAASNFRSAEGKALDPVPWSFATAPEKLPDPAKQKAQNRKAFEELKKLLAAKYSYYDLRVKSWDKLFREHEASLLAARTTQGWASAAAAMLAATEDIHLYLKLDDRIYPTGTRSVDSLFRKNLLPHYVNAQPLGDAALWGRTEDGIGYLLIGGWDNDASIEKIEEKLPELRTCNAVVIDVRPNSGGNELLAQRIAAWFVEGTKPYAKNRYRTGPGKNGFGPVYDRSVSGHAEEAKQIRLPLAVLTSRYVMSSNESFVCMMKQAPDCTVVGQKTFGSSGNPKPHELSNGITAVLPSWQDLRLDGTCFEGEGLAPDVDVPVDAADLEAKDPILEKALEILRKKIAK